MNVSQIENSAVMWIACGIPVILVMVQALLFASKTYKSGEKLGVTKTQMKTAIRSGAITSIGPSIVVLTGMLSLLITMGAPVAWMRLSLIGSVMFESLAAGFGTAAVGVTLANADEMTELAFAMGLWTMITCSVGWVIFSTLTADKMDMVQNKIAGGDTKKLSVIAGSAVIGALASFAAQHLIKVIKFENKQIVACSIHKNAIACVLGGVIMYCLLTLANKKKIGWLREWALTFAILGGMIISAIIPV